MRDQCYHIQSCLKWNNAEMWMLACVLVKVWFFKFFVASAANKRCRQMTTPFVSQRAIFSFILQCPLGTLRFFFPAPGLFFCIDRQVSGSVSWNSNMRQNQDRQAGSSLTHRCKSNRRWGPIPTPNAWSGSNTHNPFFVALPTYTVSWP